MTFQRSNAWKILNGPLSDLYGSGWPQTKFLSPETESASPKTPKTTSWTHLWCFCEKNKVPDLFSRIWPLWHDLERLLWVRMTYNWISEFTIGIRIPQKTLKWHLGHICDVLWRNIRDFFWQNGPQNGKIEKIEKSKLLKNCTLKWKITLESVIRDPSWVQISCNTSCNFLRFFLFPCVISDKILYEAL